MSVITLFCRLPSPGRAKTRLAASIARARGAPDDDRGAHEAAAAAYAAMARHAIREVRRRAHPITRPSLHSPTSPF